MGLLVGICNLLTESANPHLPPPQPVYVVVGLYIDRCIIRLYQKTGWFDFDELRVTDSTLNEGTNSLINERWNRGGADGLSYVVTQQTS